MVHCVSHQEVVLAGLSSGAFSAVSCDSSPYPYRTLARDSILMFPSNAVQAAAAYSAVGVAPQAAAAFAAYDASGTAAPKKAIPEWLRDEMKKRVLENPGASLCEGHW